MWLKHQRKFKFGAAVCITEFIDAVARRVLTKDARRSSDRKVTSSDQSAPGCTDR
jgi:hypothetical protein